jgi:hypothetical protein
MNDKRNIICVSRQKNKKKAEKENDYQCKIEMDPLFEPL